MPIERSDNEIFLHLREQTLAIETDEIGLGYFLKLLDHSSFDLAILSASKCI